MKIFTFHFPFRSVSCGAGGDAGWRKTSSDCVPFVTVCGAIPVVPTYGIQPLTMNRCVCGVSNNCEIWQKITSLCIAGFELVDSGCA